MNSTHSRRRWVRGGALQTLIALGGLREGSEILVRPRPRRGARPTPSTYPGSIYPRFIKEPAVVVMNELHIDGTVAVHVANTHYWIAAGNIAAWRQGKEEKP